MGQVLWEGGATAVAQVDTVTLNNDTDDNETFLTVTMTAEDASTQTVVIVPSGTDETVIAAALHAALVASTDTLFAAVTWTVATSVITGTATVAGVPFTITSVAYTAGLGTATILSDGTGASVLNAGPHDWNTAANWDTAAVPVAADDVKFAVDAYPVLYGLDQSAVTLDSLRIGEEYKGTIAGLSASGTTSGFYLKINSTLVVYNGAVNECWINGTCPTVNVTGGLRRDNMLRLDGDIDNLRIMGGSVKGTVSCATSMALDNVYMLGVASTAKCLISTSVTSFDLIEADSGFIQNESACVAVNTSGTAEVVHLTGAVTTATIRAGSLLRYKATAALLNLDVYGGTGDFSATRVKALVIGGGSTTEIWGGLITERSGLGNVTWTGGILQYGGNVQSDNARTITVT